MLHGTIRKAHVYQLYMVYLQLSQPVHKAHGCVNFDTMGLGKTCTAIITALVRHMLLTNLLEVRCDGDAHRAKCHGISRFGRQCACVPGGVATRIASQLNDRPSLVIVPPQLVDNWEREFAAVLGRHPTETLLTTTFIRSGKAASTRALSDASAQLLQIDMCTTSDKNGWSHQPRTTCWAPAFPGQPRTKEKLVAMRSPGSHPYRLGPAAGQSSLVIVVTSSMLPKLFEHTAVYDDLPPLATRDPSQAVKKRLQSVRLPLPFSPGLIVVDELY